jgi:(1->4)-alpha-D-glucan 1-alpha-D-glucosylmutase
MSASGFAPIPLATYRVQMGGSFTFADATAIVPYLERLGISHLYCSPYLKARPGSAHGYDIVDHNALNPEIGDEASFSAMCDALQRAGMGHILDFVPNHMGVGQSDNTWWLDVLEWGRDSLYGEYFDIDWDPAKPELRGKVLVPSLGDHYGRVLENGELQLKFSAEEGKFSVWYYDHRFPIDPAQYAPILTNVLERLQRQEGAEEAQLVEFELLVAGFRDLRRPARSSRQRTFRRSKAEKLESQFAALAQQHEALRRCIDEAILTINGESGNAKSFERLHRLLEAQHYRLASWRVAAEEINYRRFFQINDLAGIRVEVPEVFDTIHRLVLKLIGEGRLHGLRIDHIDGLFDPRGYLQRLQDKARAARTGQGIAEQSDPETEPTQDGAPFYVIVEKILAHHEKLREDWAVAGTTGYEFLNRLNGLFVDPEGAEPLERIYHRFVGRAQNFEEICDSAKRQAMDEELTSELRVLANEFNRVTEKSWLTRDYTLVGLRDALREVVACFPVYRTYVDRHGPSSEDVRDIEWAIGRARKRSTRADKSVFDFIRDVLLLSPPPRREKGAKEKGPGRREIQRLAMKFQQYTGPVMAKGVEDTAFYRYGCLVSLNEVGGEPTRFGVSPAAFHQRNQEQARRWPASMLCTSTHDTKRGEDVRARINVLSEMPHEWARKVRRWSTINWRRKTALEDGSAPSENDEYLFYQTLVGAWPLEFHGATEWDDGILADFRERMVGYMLKAVREAKSHTSWINCDSDYESGLSGFVERVLDAERRNPFLDDFQQFHRRIAELGMLNGLAQTVLKLTVPGMPDLYQGSELWDLNLVDPDNRRPVDFEKRNQMIGRLSEMLQSGANAACPQLLEHWPDGMVKLFVVWRLLSLRRSHPDVFQEGDYLPLEALGTRANHLFSFVRSGAGRTLLVCVPRLLARLTLPSVPFATGDDVWADTFVALPEELAETSWRNVFTGEALQPAATYDDRQIPAASLLRTFPVAVFEPA